MQAALISILTGKYIQTMPIVHCRQQAPSRFVRPSNIRNTTACAVSEPIVLHAVYLTTECQCLAAHETRWERGSRGE